MTAATATQPLPLTADRFLPLAYKLAHREAYVSSDVDDLVQEGLLYLHEALGRVTEQPEHPKAWAATILRRRMRSYYRRAHPRRPAPEAEQGLPEDAHDWALKVEAWQAKTHETDAYFRRYFRHLENEVGGQAVWLALNLMSPGEDVARAALKIMQEKQAIKEQNPDADVRGVKTVRVSKQLLLEAGEFNHRGEFFALLRQVKQATADFMSREGFQVG